MQVDLYRKRRQLAQELAGASPAPARLRSARGAEGVTEGSKRSRWFAGILDSPSAQGESAVKRPEADDYVSSAEKKNKRRLLMQMSDAENENLFMSARKAPLCAAGIAQSIEEAPEAPEVDRVLFEGADSPQLPEQVCCDTLRTTDHCTAVPVCTVLGCPGARPCGVGVICVTANHWFAAGRE